MLEKDKSPAALRGAVLLLGSLYWEGELQEQDGQKGKARKEWRETRLDLTTVRGVHNLPIYYGRRSASRSGQFTMVLGGNPVGAGKLAELKNKLPIDVAGFSQASVELMREEVEALATAEGIRNSSNKTHWTDWGLVAIAINPQSIFREAIRAMWTANFDPGSQFENTNFGPSIVAKSGILEVQLPWAEQSMAELDFCLATPTMPDAPPPTPKQIAEAIKQGSYFERTVSAGIVTADDEEIRSHLTD